MSLLLLAPAIQEDVLELECAATRQPISERSLRSVIGTFAWDE